MLAPRSLARPLLLLLASACGGGSSRPAGHPAPDEPCAPGPAAPPVAHDHPRAQPWASCEEACWELESLAPPGGGMPSSVSLVSCAFSNDGRYVRCVIQHERLCLRDDVPY